MNFESLLKMKQTLKNILYNPKIDGDSTESFHKCYVMIIKEHYYF